MGKNKANVLLSLFSKNIQETEQTRLWDSCKTPKTSSFRAASDGTMFKTVNSVFFDDGSEEDSLEMPQSMECSDFEAAAESLEMVVRQSRSDRDRIFFEPHGDSSSIVGPSTVAGFQESVVVAMESEDPYHDFRLSMEEMVESIGMKDWDCLEELLRWYLRMNGKSNHGFIVEAFVDLLLNLNNGGDKIDATTNTSFSSAASSFSDDFSDML